MRQLTPQEINNAPEWATHYFKSERLEGRNLTDKDYSRVRWQNNEKKMFLWSHQTCEPVTTENEFCELGEPIPR